MLKNSVGVIQAHGSFKNDPLMNKIFLHEMALVRFVIIVCNQHVLSKQASVI